MPAPIPQQFPLVLTCPISVVHQLELMNQYQYAFIKVHNLQQRSLLVVYSSMGLHNVMYLPLQCQKEVSPSLGPP